LEVTRRASLYLVPDFLVYMLAIDFCSLALLIDRSLDDLILATVFSAAGYYVLLASNTVRWGNNRVYQPAPVCDSWENSARDRRRREERSSHQRVAGTLTN